MPHNPRRDRDRSRAAAVLTDEQIAEAMARAVALRQASALRPDAVMGQPMTVSDAQSFSSRLQRPSLWDWAHGRHRAPWWWVGWVHYTPGDIAGRQTWEVWLDVEGDRVWLRYRRPPD